MRVREGGLAGHPEASSGGQLKTDNVPIVAAGVACYVFLAMVPAIVAVVSVYGLVADPVDVEGSWARW